MRLDVAILKQSRIFLLFLSLSYFFCRPYFIIPPLSPDSWSYWELSKTIFSDFYRFSTFRSFENATSYSASFPPLWPVLIGIFNSFFNAGPRGGVLLNSLLVLPILAVALERFSQKLFKIKYLGYLVFFLTLCDIAFMEEVFAGRSIPLQILIFLFLFSALFDLKLGNKDGGGERSFVLVAALLGLSLLNRFDAMAIVPVVVISVCFLRPSFKSLSVFMCTLLVTVSPWIVYSLWRFNSVWKTDNSFVAKAVSPTYVTDWYPAAILTIEDDFWAWLARIYSNLYPLFFAVGRGFSDLIIPFVATVAIIVIAKCSSVFGGGSKTPKMLFFDKMNLRSIPLFSLFFFLFALSSLIPNLLTGYFDLRYFSFLRIIFLILFFGLLFRVHSNGSFAPNFGLAKDIAEDSFVRFVLTEKQRLCILLCLVPLLFYLARENCLVFSSTLVNSEDSFVSPSWVSDIKLCIEEIQEEEQGVQGVFSGLFVFDTVNPFQFGAETGIKTAMVPENFKDLSPTERALFFRSFYLSHLYSCQDQSKLTAELGLGFRKLDCSDCLYEMILQ